MKTQIRTFLLIITVFGVTASPLRAQIVNDGETKTLTDVTNTFPGDVTVGTNGSFTLLVLSNNALLTNSANGVIGRNATAKSNEVRLLSASARWLMGGSLFVGNDGSFNRLVVSNGASVRDNTGFVGPNAPGSNNLAVVTGPGSVWSNANVFYLGFNGAGNQLVVSNGGVLRANVSDVGVSSSSSNNLAVVTGSGSLWSNAFELQFGFNGAGNQLVISNGGIVRSSLGYLGSLAPASNNLALVTGPGSLWTNTTDLYIGQSGAGNRLVVSDGGTVRNGHGYVGGSTSGSNNLVSVAGAGAAWSNALNLEIGLSSGNNRMIVSNGATVFTAGTGSMGSATNANANSVTVTDPGTRWIVASNLYVGSNGALSRLTISNGGLVANRLGVIGFSASSSNNLALVTGSGSVWSNRSEFHVGHFSAGNQLVVSNGGFVSAESGEIGSEIGSVNNQVVVIGSGSKWSNTNLLYVGNYGVSNRLVVANGGAVLNDDGYIGSEASSSNNLALVTGAGSVWTNTAELYVGNSGRGNQLVVSNGALVVNSNGIIGFNGSSIGNLATVSGAGTVWSNRQDLVVGDSGNGNRLEVSDGARVESRFACLGTFLSASNNAAVVTGPGSLWRIVNGMRVGSFSAGNRLVISNGGWVRTSSDSTIIGSNASATNNEIVVTGAGSSWTNGSSLIVGGFGSGNRLVITNGGEVFNQGGFGITLGSTSQSTNNRIVVDGGSLMVSNVSGNGVLDIRRGTNILNAGLIDVQQLRLTNALGFFEFNGGTLITRGAAISNNAPFTVGGPGGVPATWDVRAGAGNHAVEFFLAVGDNTAFNRLLVTNGTTLISSEGIIGFNSGANSNTAVVSGLGSRWVMSPGDFSVGSFGSGNSLVISNGGFVSAGFSDLGASPESSNNLAVVTGVGTVWSNQMVLIVGRSGPGNRLLIADSGTVFAGDRIDVGTLPVSSSNNLLHVANGTLFVTNGAATGTLDIRSGTNRFDAGLIQVDRLRLTNSLGRFEFNGGKLSVGNSTVSNGQLFRIGNGVSPATFAMTGNGAHSFANGLTVSANAFLTGNGAVSGILSVQPSGNLAPGASIGKIVLSNSPSLQGTVFMEISKNGAPLTNDQIQVTAPLTYGGSLIVTNLGPTALAAGDRFPLFSAPSFAGIFSTLSLPKPGTGLNWTNKLLVDGSIEVVTWAGPRIGDLTRSGTNLILSVTDGFPGGAYDVLTATNILTPLTNWITLSSATFDSFGNTTVTNGIALAEPKRYFRIRIP